MKKIVLALMLVAAIAFVAVGQTQTDIVLYPELENWEALGERLGLQEGDRTLILSQLNAIVDRIEALEDFVDMPEELVTITGVWTPYLDHPFLPGSQIITIPEIDEADVPAWNPNPVTVFLIGAAVGAFICWLLL